MANTYKLIEVKTLASAVSGITFSSIPATYTDLKVVFSARSSYATDIIRGCLIRFNSDTTNANYTYKRIYGSGSGAPSSDSSIYSLFINADQSTANTFGNAEIYVSNYTSSNIKSSSLDYITENDATAAYIGSAALNWSGTATINSITIEPEAGNLMVNSTFYLYGIKNS
jgi:hypothetical protein